jgi:hypothetical protein
MVAFPGSECQFNPDACTTTARATTTRPAALISDDPGLAAAISTRRLGLLGALWPKSLAPATGGRGNNVGARSFRGLEWITGRWV